MAVKGRLIHSRFSAADKETCKLIAADMRELYPGALVRMFHRRVKADKVCVPVCIITVREKEKTEPPE